MKIYITRELYAEIGRRMRIDRLEDREYKAICLAISTDIHKALELMCVTSIAYYSTADEEKPAVRISLELNTRNKSASRMLRRIFNKYSPRYEYCSNNMWGGERCVSLQETPPCNYTTGSTRLTISEVRFEWDEEFEEAYVPYSALGIWYKELDRVFTIIDSEEDLPKEPTEKYYFLRADGRRFWRYDTNL